MFGSRRSRKIDEKKDGYKFAITFLATISSSVYTIFNYSEKNYISTDNYLIILMAVSAGGISILCFFIYIILKGFSMELKKSRHKDDLDSLASYIYKIGLIIFFVLIIYLFLLFFRPVDWILTLLVLFLIFILSNLISAYSKNEAIISVIIFVVFIFIGAYFIYSAGYAEHLLPLRQPTVEMQSVYYKNDLQIPALIQLTGPNTKNLAIFLFKETSGNLSEIANISLNKSSLNQEIKYNNYMLGNELGYGKFNVFINTTNLSTGYYELLIIRDFFSQNMSSSKGFFFFNSSKS